MIAAARLVLVTEHMKAFALLAILAAGCNDGCPGGVCADPDYSTHRPGPCESGYALGDYTQHCRYHYGGEQLTNVDCDWDEGGEDGEYGTDTSDWTYDAAGSVTVIDTFHDDVA